MANSQTRVLRRALFTSIALHAFILGWWYETVGGETAYRAAERPALNGTLVSARAANAAGSAQRIDSRPRSREAPVAQNPLYRVAKAERRVLPDTSLAGDRASAPATGGSNAPPSAVVAGRETDSGDSANPESLREYRLALGRQASRLKTEFERRYSGLGNVRHARPEGRVDLTVRAQSGVDPVVALAKTSGHPQLDEQAIELIGRAVQLTALPTSLLGKSFFLPVSLEFRVTASE